VTSSQLHKRKISPSNPDDPRLKRDSYWFLRNMGYPHAYAKRALRNEPVRYREELTPALSDVQRELLLVDWSERLRVAEVLVRPEQLTDEIIHNAPCLGYEYSLPDGVIPGLALRVRASGHKSFVLYFRIHLHRKTRKMRIAQAGAMTIVQVRDIARRILVMARCGRDPESEPLLLSGNELTRTDADLEEALMHQDMERHEVNAMTEFDREMVVRSNTEEETQLERDWYENENQWKARERGQTTSNACSENDIIL
jgi:hypothetical protein